MISAHDPCQNALKYTDTTTDITFMLYKYLEKTNFSKMIFIYFLLNLLIVSADLASYNRWGNNFVTVDLRKKPKNLVGYRLKLTEYLVRKRNPETLDKLSKMYSKDHTEQTEKSVAYYNNMAPRLYEPVVATFIDI